MILARSRAFVFGLGLVIACPFLSWAQSDAVNAQAQSDSARAQQIESLQQQLTAIKEQMQSVEAKITALSNGSSAAGSTASSTNAAAIASTPNTGNPSSAGQSFGANTASPGAQEESSAAQAAQLHLTPKREVVYATASYETDSQDQLAAPRIDNAPLDPSYPGYFRLPGTQTLLRIGGYFKTDFIYDLKPAGNAESFIPSSFPIPSITGVNNTTVSIRPTRMNLDFLVPVSSSSVRFFLEFDMFGSSSTTPRLRHAYAQVKNILLGQSFSNFMDPDSGPDTLDFQGPNAQVLIRNPQFRYTMPIAEKRSLSFSVEKASSDILFKTSTFNSLPNSPTPDFAIKFRQDFSKGHLQISSLLRTPAAYLPDGRNESVFGWGFNVTGALDAVGKDVFVYQGAYGAGMERYVNDTSGLGIDAAPKDAARPHLEAVPMVATYGGYQHYWGKPLRSSLVYGYVQAENTDLEPSSAFHRSNYLAGNIIWNPFGSLNVGTEFLYGTLVEKNNAKGNAPRFMFSAKYNFVKSPAAKK